MPRPFNPTDGIQHQTLAGFLGLVKLPRDQNGSWDLSSNIRNPAPSTVGIPHGDNVPWEKLRCGSGENDFVVSAQANWGQFWRDLQHLPTFPTHAPPAKCLIHVGVSDTKFSFDVSNGLDTSLEAVGLEVVRPANANFDHFKTTIQNGADAVLIFAHGNEHGLEPSNPNAPALPASDLEAAFLASSEKGHPLRFLYVMACDQRAAFLGLVARLAQKNALHPDFAGIVMWEKPSDAWELVFREAFLGALLQGQPFLLAVHSGRRALAQNVEYAQYAWQPVAVACHHQPNPLPSVAERQYEAYCQALRVQSLV